MNVDVDTILDDLLAPLHASAPAELVFWSTDELLALLDESIKRFAKEGAFVAPNTITLSAGTAVYDTPPRHLSTLHVSHANKPLKPSSTQELELRDPHFAVTPGIPKYWYADKGGMNRVGLYPVPDATAVALAGSIQVIHHAYPLAPDGLVTAAITVPRVVADMFEAEVIAEAYAKEGDSQCPEIAASEREIVRLYNSAMGVLWGGR